MRRADVDAPADAGVLTLGVLADAHHVDVGRSAVGERGGEASQQAHRPQVDVLIEALTDAEQQVGGDAIRHRRRADGAEVDRVEGGEPSHAVFIHHALMFQIVFTAPRQLGEVQRDSAAARRRFEHGDARRDDFFADAVTGDDRNSMRGHQLVGSRLKAQGSRLKAQGSGLGRPEP